MEDLGLKTKCIEEYLPEISKPQSVIFLQLQQMYLEKNEQVNLISRKDIGHIVEHHFLHSLFPVKIWKKLPPKTIIDVGTGGGLPGIPLAIYYPKVHFILVDSIQKKIGMVEEMVTELGLKNITVVKERVEKMNVKVDGIIARSVANTPTLLSWCKQLLDSKNRSSNHGFWLLKGGELKDELSQTKKKYHLYNIFDYFKLDHYRKKFLIHIP